MYKKSCLGWKEADTEVTLNEKVNLRRTKPRCYLCLPLWSYCPCLADQWGAGASLRFSTKLNYHCFVRWFFFLFFVTASSSPGDVNPSSLIKLCKSCTLTLGSTILIYGLCSCIWKWWTAPSWQAAWLLTRACWAAPTLGSFQLL